MQVYTKIQKENNTRDFIHCSNFTRIHSLLCCLYLFTLIQKCNKNKKRKKYENTERNKDTNTYTRRGRERTGEGESAREKRSEEIRREGGRDARERKSIIINYNNFKSIVVDGNNTYLLYNITFSKKYHIHLNLLLLTQCLA